MKKVNRKTVLAKAIKTFGPKAQLVVAIEEMAELTKLLCKKLADRFDNSGYNKISVIDEVADVLLMIEQVKIIFVLTDDEINERITFKVNRLKIKLDQLGEKAKKAGIKI